MIAARSRPAHTPKLGRSFALACLVSATTLLATSCGNAATRAGSERTSEHASVPAAEHTSEPAAEISRREQAATEFLAALNSLQWLQLADITQITTFEELVGRGTEGLLVGEFSGKSTVETGVDPSFPWDEQTKGIAGAAEPVQRSTLRLALTSVTSQCDTSPSEVSVMLALGVGDDIGTRELDAHPILRSTERLEGVQVLIPLTDCTAPDASAQMMILAPASDSQATAGSQSIDLHGDSFSTVAQNAQKYWTTSVEHRYRGGSAGG